MIRIRQSKGLARLSKGCGHGGDLILLGGSSREKGRNRHATHRYSLSLRLPLNGEKGRSRVRYLTKECLNVRVTRRQHRANICDRALTATKKSPGQSTLQGFCELLRSFVGSY